jgi:hypothetical protein
MTALPVRDIGFAQWEDPHAWMETMEGSKWNTVIKEENKYVSDYIKQPKVKRRIASFTEFAEKGAEESAIPYVFRCGPISISPLSSMFLFWRFITKPYKSFYSTDVFADSRGAWTLNEIGHGALVYQLEFWEVDKNIPTWSIKPVGQTIAIIENRCYYTGVFNKLWFNELWSCDAETGKDAILHYKELNPEIVLNIVRYPNNKVYMTRENAQDLTYYKITQGKLIEEKEPEHTWHGLTVKRSNGKSTLYKSNEKVVSIPAGRIVIDPWASFLNSQTAHIIVEQPHSSVRCYKWENNSLKIVNRPIDSGLKIIEEKIDGIRYVIVCKKEVEKPEHVLITGYGAYGLATNTEYAKKRWNPLLESNWAIGYTFLPGGGDHTTAFAKMGRLSGRQKTIDAFLKCVRHIKTTYKLRPENIVIYGRSAGGLLVGGSLNEVPDGSLFGGIFTEVAYLDELRTTTNPDLPLTQLEYNEFGNPSRSIEEFLSVGLLSPANSAMSLKTPNVFIYAKTATNDTQVYAYESVKWIRRLRTKGKPKLLKINVGIGHFTPPNMAVKTSALDCAILDTLVMQD